MRDSTPTVLCANCGGEVPRLRVGRLGLARCPGCGRLLDFDPLLPARAPPRPEFEVAVPHQPQPAPLGLRRDAPFPMPEDAVVRETPEALTLAVPELLGRFPVAAVAGWLGLGTLAFALATSGAASFNWLAAAVAALSSYLLVQAAVNRRVFRADADGLEVGTGPLPWLKRTRRFGALRELFAERNWTEGTASAFRFTWELAARTAAGKKVLLIEGASDPVLVHWLGQRLAERLGIGFTPAKDP